MYSPKIREDLIPYLHRLAKERNMPMTELVDLLLRPQVMQLSEELKEFPIEKRKEGTAS